MADLTGPPGRKQRMLVVALACTMLLARPALSQAPAMLRRAQGLYHEPPIDERRVRAGAPGDSVGPQHGLTWRWRRFGPLDYLVTGLLAGAYAFAALGTRQSQTAAWTGPILFDDTAGRALVANTPAGRNRADSASDVFAASPLALVVAESLALPLVADGGNTDTALHLTLINVQAASLAGALTTTGKRLTRRERPDVADCQADPEHSDRCSNAATGSFPSGHATMAFVGAGLGCTHHLMLNLLGDPTLDIASCVVLSAAAATGATLRIVADRHHASDVLVGMGVGLGAGIGLPLLAHYRAPSNRGADRLERTPGASWSIVPFTLRGGAGLSIYGQF